MITKCSCFSVSPSITVWLRVLVLPLGRIYCPPLSEFPLTSVWLLTLLRKSMVFYSVFLLFSLKAAFCFIVSQSREVIKIASYFTIVLTLCTTHSVPLILSLWSFLYPFLFLFVFHLFSPLMQFLLYLYLDRFYFQLSWNKKKFHIEDKFDCCKDKELIYWIVYFSLTSTVFYF